MINAARVERQLTPAFGDDKATLIASMAAALSQIISESPLHNFASPHLMPGIAVIYGTALRVTQEAIDSPHTDQATKDAATRSLDDMQRAVTLVNAPDTRPESSLDQIMRDLMAKMAAENLGVPTASVGGDPSGEPGLGDEFDTDDSEAEEPVR